MELEGGDTMELDGGATGHARTSGVSGGIGGGGSSGGDVDRLSALPDSLLHAIMSFLKARQAVQTCVLGTRWRHLWRAVPCLDVDQDEFRAVPKPANNNIHHPAAADVDNSDIEFDPDDDDDDDDMDGGNDDDDNEWDNFEDFADSLMHHCNIGMLDSLRLHVSKDRAPSFANRQAGGWIRRAMKYSTPDPPSRQLEGLGLRPANSWRLKRLYLCNVALDCRFTMHVSSVCQSLEDLELVDCVCAIHAINSNSLKSLVLKNCNWNYLSEIASPTLKSLVIAGGSNSYDCVLVIRAPAIAHLCLDVSLRFAKRVAVN